MSGEQTRIAILENASRLFASKGYAAVSMRDVATEVGVTPANLYYHFTDKEQLIRASLLHVFSGRTASIETIFRRPIGDGEKIDAFVNWLTELLFSDSVFAKLLLRELLDGDADRLKFLSKTVFDRPMSLIMGSTGAHDRAEALLSAISIVGIVLGHFQLAGALPHLPGGGNKQTSPRTVARHIRTMLRRAFVSTRAGSGA
jgi:AcrR family transcriptional regulator